MRCRPFGDGKEDGGGGGVNKKNAGYEKLLQRYVSTDKQRWREQENIHNSYIIAI